MFDWSAMASFLDEEMGYLLQPDKHYLMEQNCVPLLKQLAVDNPAALIAKCRTDIRARQILINAMTINESYFFRDTKLWNDVASRLLVELKPEVEASRRLNILLCACSTGQELCTILIMLHEQFALVQDLEIQIISTDIDDVVLERAMQATYSDLEVSRGLSEERKHAHFQHTAAGWQLKREYLDQVSFQKLNLMDEFCFARRFDLAFCRNVMIYFSVETKRKVLVNLAKNLNNHGFLVIGGCESLHDYNDIWVPRHLGSTTFYTKHY